MPKELPFSIELLQEWDTRLDAMETLFDASVALDEPCEEILATVQKLRRQLRDLVPLENLPITEAPVYNG